MSSSLLDSIDRAFPAQIAACDLPSASPTSSFWLSENDLEHVGQASVPTASDVTVIGSGITGVAALWHIVSRVSNDPASRALRIVLLEARGFCTGATGRNGGHCCNVSALDFSHAAQVHGRDEAMRACLLEERCVSEIKRLVTEHGLRVDLAENDRLDLFETQQEEDAARASIAAAKEAGFDVQRLAWLNEQTLRDEHGIEGMHSAVRIAGNNLWPWKLVRQLYSLAQQKAREKDIEVSLYTHTPATAVELKGGCWLVKTSRGEISSKLILHATNGYATHLLPELCKAPRSIVPCRNQVIAVRPPASSKVWKASLSAHQSFDYAFQRPVDSAVKAPLIILGGGRHKSPAPHELGVSDDSKLNTTISRYLRSFLPDLMPGAFPRGWLSWLWGGVKVEQEWSGIMGFSQDRDPLVGELPHLPGQFLCAGYSGHGMSRAFSCAEAVAAMLVAQLEGRDAPEWPSWLPLHFRAS